MHINIMRDGNALHGDVTVYPVVHEPKGSSFLCSRTCTRRAAMRAARQTFRIVSHSFLLHILSVAQEQFHITQDIKHRDRPRRERCSEDHHTLSSSYSFKEPAQRNVELKVEIVFHSFTLGSNIVVHHPIAPSLNRIKASASKGKRPRKCSRSCKNHHQSKKDTLLSHAQFHLSPSLFLTSACSPHSSASSACPDVCAG